MLSATATWDLVYSEEVLSIRSQSAKALTTIILFFRHKMRVGQRQGRSLIQSRVGEAFPYFHGTARASPTPR